MRMFVSLAAAAVIAAGLSVGPTAGPVKAATIVFEFDYEFSGATEPEGTAPWLTATFSDIVGGVSLVIEATSLTASEFVSKFFFNTDGISVTVTADDPPGTAPAGTVTLNPAQSADGAGKFDVLIDFPTSGTTFTNGLVSNWLIEGALTTANILSLSDHPNNPRYIAAHIQSILNGESGWITGDPQVIPLPAGLLLFLSGLAGIGFLGRYKAKRHQPTAA
jgi:hypothetical protein